MTTSGWPAHLRVGALRVVRSSANYDETIEFYRDLVGLAVVGEFRDSYGEDGTIFGFDQLVFYLADQAAVDEATGRLLASGVRPEPEQHPYWEENGGTTFRDPDGRGIVFVSWVFGRDPQPSDRANGN